MPFDRAPRALNDVALLGLHGTAVGAPVCEVTSCYGSIGLGQCQLTQKTSFQPVFSADGSPLYAASYWNLPSSLQQQLGQNGYGGCGYCMTQAAWLLSAPTKANPCPSLAPNYVLDYNTYGPITWRTDAVYNTPASGQSGIYEWPPAAAIAGVALVCIAVAIAGVTLVRRVIRTGKGRELPVAEESALAESRYGVFEKRGNGGRIMRVTRRLYEGTQEAYEAHGWERTD